MAQGTHDGLVELLLDELMPVHLVHVALALAHGALTVEGFVWASCTGDCVLYCNIRFHVDQYQTLRSVASRKPDGSRLGAQKRDAPKSKRN